MDETLDSLHAAGGPDAIVVAVDNGGRRRLDEYSPWRNARYGGGDGDAVRRLPGAHAQAVHRPAATARCPDARNTGIAGWSMGGLISLYAGLKYPEVFGRVGVFSPALWFAPPLFAYARAGAAACRGQRFYFVTGAHEGDTPRGVRRATSAG